MDAARRPRHVSRLSSLLRLLLLLLLLLLLFDSFGHPSELSA